MINVVTDFKLHILGGDNKRHWSHIGKVQEKPNTNRYIVSSALVINTEMSKKEKLVVLQNVKQLLHTPTGLFR